MDNYHWENILLYGINAHELETAKFSRGKTNPWNTQERWVKEELSNKHYLEVVEYLGAKLVNIKFCWENMLLVTQ